MLLHFSLSRIFSFLYNLNSTSKNEYCTKGKFTYTLVVYLNMTELKTLQMKVADLFISYDLYFILN